ncbi:uncharacterized protein LOC130804557 [Amaranthus tricolor]|uniref:uncharacterized protein LOC130804557 n=1 Tax=Amaranthus tricolor TaxID=29722 RepID=UPI00258343ED|nr:uncharacterized protein LOC130804557 [Amaranthus tricolor]
MAKTRGSSTSKSGHQRGRSIPVDIPSTSNLHLNSNTRKRRAEETDNVQQRSVRLRSTFQTKSRPSQLIKLMKGFTEKQKISVREIGFGGLLDLKLCRNPSAMLGWLVDCIKEETSANHFGSGLILSTYPVSQTMVFEYGQAVGLKVNNVDIGQPSVNAEPFRDQTVQDEDKIEFHLPLNAMRNSEIRQVAEDVSMILLIYV